MLRSADGRVAVSIRLDDLRPAAARLRALGIAATDGAPGFAYARLTPAELRRLTTTDGIASIAPVLRLTPALDRSLPATAAPVARAEHGLDGAGVLIGTIDTGCDFRHADLRRADGKTRIEGLLDHAHAADLRHPGAAHGGAVWLRDEIDAQLAADAGGPKPAVPVAEVDVDGHGTHVIGIAAGNGRATGRQLPAGRYLGVAPGASIVCVQATRDGHTFLEPDVLEGVRFILDRARALGRPAVVNLSLSAEGGPHDGTTPLEQALLALVPSDATGQVLVIAAGNGADKDRHAGGWSQGGPIELSLPMPSDGKSDTVLALDLWFSGSPPSLTLVAPSGRVFGPVAAGDRLDAGAEPAEGRVDIDNALGADPQTGRHGAYLDVEGNHGKPPAGGTWKLILDGRAARWDAWLLGVPPGASLPRFLDHLDEETRGQTPAFTRSAIAVGSFVSRNDWRSRDGTLAMRSTVVGRASAFSGTGPTADGRFFPDLAAPGDFIASSLSSAALPDLPGSAFHVPNAPDYLWADDGVHALLRGTSQAAPHVAGAIALLLQVDPTLTPERVRELLRASATVEPGAPGYTSRGGFGHLDVARAAWLLVGRATGAVDATASTVGASRDAVPPGETRVQISVVPRDAAGDPIGTGRAVSIDARDDGAGIAGAWDGPVHDLGAGRYERTLRAAGPRGTAFAVTATVDGVTLAAHPTVWLVADRSDIGRPFAAVGGCAVGGAAPAPNALWLAAALLVLLGQAKKRRVSLEARTVARGGRRPAEGEATRMPACPPDPP